MKKYMHKMVFLGAWVQDMVLILGCCHVFSGIEIITMVINSIVHK